MSGCSARLDCHHLPLGGKGNRRSCESGPFGRGHVLQGMIGWFRWGALRTRAMLRRPGNAVAIVALNAHAVGVGTDARPGERARRRLSAGGSTLNTESMSAGDDVRPNVRRREPRTQSDGNPRAEITCDGSVAPEVHAEPLDAPICAMSRVSRMLSPSTCRNTKLALFGSLSVGWPVRRASPIVSSTFSMSSSRSTWTWEMVARRSLTARRSAVASPTIPDVFSVPPRRLRSWAPPLCCGCQRVPPRT